MKLVRGAFQAPVPGDPGGKPRIVRGIQPDDPPSPAESRDAELGAIAPCALRSPCGRGIEVAHHLRVWRLGNDPAHDLLDVGDLRNVSLPRVKLWRDRQVA